MSAVLDRFLRYVTFDTQSNESSSTYPSTSSQLVLLRTLADELEALGASDVKMDEHGYVTATVPATSPKPGIPTIGFIAQHLVNDNYLFCNNFGSQKGTRSAKDTTTADSVKATWPKDTLVAKLKESFTFCQNAFNHLDDAKLADQVTMTFGGQSRQVTRAGMVLGHALDLADHYSQLANYMRLNNILPPTALPRPRPGG